jgi:hypothetical protein
MSKEEKSLFEKMYEAGEEQMSRFAKEAVAHPSFSTFAEKALRNVIETKGKVDKNLNQFFNLLNIPSKADYNKLFAKVETLQGSIVNLSIKMDRLIATMERSKKTPPRRTKRPSPTSPSEPSSTSR